ncbi:hypothetical protein F8388_017133 [Cannabis sativa]|uniref:SBP-type domain-containing protein n=1 Tax=Cannabis sativa TaxID=3483 RepID=A0A7J6GF92_CANSA|nr:hypothetical protein F8388_017133 [Cannabis sativa]
MVIRIIQKSMIEEFARIALLCCIYISSSSSIPLKRTRGLSSSNEIQVSSCLVDGCDSDLTKCWDCHRRHKVCETHSKTPKVTIEGYEQRFCQQCSRQVETRKNERLCRVWWMCILWFIHGQENPVALDLSQCQNLKRLSAVLRLDSRISRDIAMSGVRATTYAEVLEKALEAELCESRIQKDNTSRWEARKASNGGGDNKRKLPSNQHNEADKRNKIGSNNYKGKKPYPAS